MAWNLVSKSKKVGGLGFRPSPEMNQAFLGYWLWRLGDDHDGLWKQIITAKYGFGRNGWDLPIVHPHRSGALSVKEAFLLNIRFHIGTGEHIESSWIPGWEVGHWPHNFSLFFIVQGMDNVWLLAI